MYDIIIVGAGPAGMTAALYAKQARKNILVLEKEIYGGQILKADKVKNYPGFKEKYFVEYRQTNNEYIRAIKEGYRRLDKGKYSIPIIEYFTNLGRIKDLEKLGFNLEDKKLPVETRNFDTVTRMLYGFPVKPRDVIEINKMKIMTRR